MKPGSMAPAVRLLSIDGVNVAFAVRMPHRGGETVMLWKEGWQIEVRRKARGARRRAA